MVKQEELKEILHKADLKITRSRINIPVKNYGEHLYVSLGGKYNFRKNNIENKNGYYGIEGGVYALFGILGFQFFH